MQLIIAVFFLFASMLILNIGLHNIGVGDLIRDIITFSVVVFILGYLFYNSSITYEYSLICEELIIKEVKNSKTKTVLDINVNQIETLEAGPLSREIKKEYIAEKRYIKAYKSSKHSYYCYYTQDHEKYCFQFEPSEKLLERMANNMSISSQNN